MSSSLGTKANEVGAAADDLVASDDASGTKATSVARAVSQLLGEASKSGASTHVLQSAMNVADTAGKVIAAKRSKSDNVNALNEALKADIKQLHEALNEEPKKSSADDKKRRKKEKRDREKKEAEEAERREAQRRAAEQAAAKKAADEAAARKAAEDAARAREQREANAAAAQAEAAPAPAPAQEPVYVQQAAQPQQQQYATNQFNFPALPPIFIRGDKVDPRLPTRVLPFVAGAFPAGPQYGSFAPQAAAPMPTFGGYGAPQGTYAPMPSFAPQFAQPRYVDAQIVGRYPAPYPTRY